MSETRRFATILATNVAGLSRLVGMKEGGILFAPIIARHSGRLVKATDDGLVAEFGSVMDTPHCAGDAVMLPDKSYRVSVRSQRGRYPRRGRGHYLVWVNLR